jgi:predicted adenylyl cyclase CyaB
MKNQEVEYRAILNSNIFTNLLKIGKSKYKSSFKGPIIIEDIYYCQKHVKSFKEVEMDDIGSFSLRLRKEFEDDKFISTINTKIITKFGDHNAWKEHETIISSHKDSDQILKSIGFKNFFTFKKERYTYKVDDILVCLEKIKGFGCLIEVEIMTTKNKAEIAKEKLLKFLELNNIKKEAIVKKSVTNMLMKEKSIF